MTDSFDSNRFFALIPKLLANDTFRSHLEGNLDANDKKALARLARGKSPSKQDMYELYDFAYDAFQNNLSGVLALGWDGDFPGASGAIWISELAGVYVISSSDFGPVGPFDSIEEALTEDYFHVVTANPTLDCDVLPLRRLLEVARGIVDWESGGDIWVNGKRYVVRGVGL